MDRNFFSSYLKDEVIPRMTAPKNVIFFDKHWSDVSLTGIQMCIDSGKNIQLVCRSAGQTSKLQQWDKTAFGGVKTKCRQHLRDLHTDVINPLTRNSFPKHLIDLWSTFGLERTLKDGFRQTGIFPFLPQVIRKTVNISAVPKPVDTNQHSEEKRQIRESLVKMNCKEPDILTILEIADRSSKGITQAMQNSMNLSDLLNAGKKVSSGEKRKRDMRLDSCHGLLVTSKTVQLALSEEADKKAKKALQEGLKRKKTDAKTDTVADASTALFPPTRKPRAKSTRAKENAAPETQKNQYS